MFKERRPIVMLTHGNSELLPVQTAALQQNLLQSMQVGRLDLDSTTMIDSKVDVLIVAGPLKKFSDKKKFQIDQYVMSGGKVIWLIDQFALSLDSLRNNQVYVPRPSNHGLEDLFFKYGVRVNNNLVLDLNNAQLAQVRGAVGGEAQVELYDWPYYPLLSSTVENPIVGDVNRVFSRFPSSIEVLNASDDITATTLLQSSNFSRYQQFPMRLSFEIMDAPVIAENYNKGPQTIGVILEGQFESFYKNRVSASMHDGLKALGQEYKDKSISTAQVFIADSEIIANEYNPNSREPYSQMGFNFWDRTVYPGNTTFIINLIDYLLDDQGLVAARNKKIELRPLNTTKFNEEKTKWRVINIVAPLLLLALFGLIYNYLRRKKYSI